MDTAHNRLSEIMKKRDHFNDAYDAFLAAIKKMDSNGINCDLTDVQYVTYGDTPDNLHAEVSTSPFEPTHIYDYDAVTNTFRYSHSIGDWYMPMHSGQREAVGSEEPMYTTKYDEEAFQDRFWDMVHHVQEQTTCTTEEAKEFVLKMMTSPTLAYSPQPASEEELDTTEAEKHLEELLS